MLIFCFLSYRGNLCMIHYDSDLFFDICNGNNSTIKDKTTIFHQLFQACLISRKKWLKKSLNNFICFIINHDFYVITLLMYYTLFIRVFKRNVPGFLRLFMVSFKSGSRYRKRSFHEGFLQLIWLVRQKLFFWSILLRKSLMPNSIFCAII